MLMSCDIQSKLTKTEIRLDGIMVQGVRKFSIEQEVGMEIPAITLKCISHDFNMNIERADVVFEFKDGWIDVEKLLPELEESVLALVKDKHGIHQEVLWREHFNESDAVYEGDYWCCTYMSNIEAMGLNKVLAWQELPKKGAFGYLEEVNDAK